MKEKEGKVMQQSKGEKNKTKRTVVRQRKKKKGKECSKEMGRKPKEKTLTKQAEGKRERQLW